MRPGSWGAKLAWTEPEHADEEAHKGLPESMTVKGRSRCGYVGQRPWSWGECEAGATCC